MISILIESGVTSFSPVVQSQCSVTESVIQTVAYSWPTAMMSISTTFALSILLPQTGQKGKQSSQLFSKFVKICRKEAHFLMGSVKIFEKT